MSGRQAHLTGVGGVGMSGLARALQARGWSVSGSDRDWDTRGGTPALAKLAGLGVRLYAQDGSGVAAGADRLVVSSAIEEDNPDLRAARAGGVPVSHRAEMLAELIGPGPMLAVTGTSGKTTVTGMVGVILEGLGADPMVVNGGAVLNWATDRELGNARPGRGPWVIEADESDRSLMRFFPDWAVITNISGDHFAEEEVRGLFGRFRGQVKGAVIDPLAPGTVPDADLTQWGSCFTWRGAEVRLAVPGRHNVENAVQALSVCEAMGHSVPDAARALAAFKGIERRLQWVGERDWLAVVDDFAHNPAKIEAAWRTVAPYYRRVLGVWRPHGFAPLAAMADALADLFPRLCADRHRLYLLPPYYAGGTAKAQASSEELAARVRAAGGSAEYAPSYAALESALRAEARPGDVALVMGARDPDLPLFCRRLAGVSG